MENSVDTLQKVIKFVVPLHKVKSITRVRHLIDEKCIYKPGLRSLRKSHLAIHLALPALASSLPIWIPLLQDDSIQRLPQGFCMACHGRFSREGIVHIDGYKSQRRLGCGKGSNTSLIDQKHTSLTNNAGSKEILDGQLSRNMFGRSDGQLPQAHTWDQSVRLLHPT